jgi:hypothetical protein
MVHAEARPYVCTYCNKGFLSTTKLKVFYDIMDKGSIATFIIVTVFMGTAIIPFLGSGSQKINLQTLFYSYWLDYLFYIRQGVLTGRLG